MSTTVTSTAVTSPVTTSRTPGARSADPAADVEVLARRTLGIAANAIHHGGHSTPLSRLEPSLAERAKVLLERRVPAGPERELALELLDRAVESEGGPSRTDTAAHPSVAPSYELRRDRPMSE